ncbi:MAG: type V CRISPR-associated endonuclease Cas1 [bacterium]
MFTHKDIENKTIFVINGTENQKLQVKSGYLHLLDTSENKTVTKFPFPKILFLIVIGHTSITTALIERCNKYKVPIVVMKPNFRSVYYFGNFAEANFLLRRHQCLQPKFRIDLAQHFVKNKFVNQLGLLEKTRKKDELTVSAQNYLKSAVEVSGNSESITELMTLEGRVAKLFFKAYFSEFDWHGRKPRVKIDPYNSSLDIGYTFLFNFIENMCRLFGFDLYVGVYHQLWFKRKSLVCDFMEPFRCIIDHTMRKAFNYGTFQEKDFVKRNNAYYLKYSMNSKYTKEFYTTIIGRKMEIFIYIQRYYRAFMSGKSIESFPVFIYK